MKCDALLRLDEVDRGPTDQRLALLQDLLRIFKRLLQQSGLLILHRANVTRRVETAQELLLPLLLRGSVLCRRRKHGLKVRNSTALLLDNAIELAYALHLLLHL